MEVDVVKAAMQSIASVIISLLSGLMMISEPSRECRYLRKQELDHCTQFYPQYLIHVESYVNPRKPRTPMPTKQAKAQNATYRIASRRGVVEQQENRHENYGEASRRGVVEQQKNRHENYREVSRRVVVVGPSALAEDESKYTNYSEGSR
jgi:hypothetical protein